MQSFRPNAHKTATYFELAIAGQNASTVSFVLIVLLANAVLHREPVKLEFLCLKTAVLGDLKYLKTNQ